MSIWWFWKTWDTLMKNYQRRRPLFINICLLRALFNRRNQRHWQWATVLWGFSRFLKFLDSLKHPFHLTPNRIQSNEISKFTFQLSTTLFIIIVILNLAFYIKLFPKKWIQILYQWYYSKITSFFIMKFRNAN